MLWVLQNNYVHGMTGRLAWALRLTGRPMHDFSLVPGEPLPSMPMAQDDAYFFYGSTGLLQRLRTSCWAGSVFDSALTLDQRHWAQHLGHKLLNPHFEVMTLGELRQRELREEFFVRPVVDQKAFTGGVIKPGDLGAIFRGHKGWFREQPDELLLALSPVVPDIRSEYRFVLHEGQVRLGSRYKHLGKLAVNATVPADVWSAAQVLAQAWTPASLCVMDLAVLGDDSVRVVEFNSIHSSGLYAIPGEAYAEVVEEAVRKRRGTASCDAGCAGGIG